MIKSNFPFQAIQQGGNYVNYYISSGQEIISIKDTHKIQIINIISLEINTIIKDTIKAIINQLNNHPFLFRPQIMQVSHLIY